MFAEEIATITPGWPEWVFITIYLATGFIVSLFAIRDGRCESPAETLMFGTLTGGIFVGVLLLFSPLILLYGAFALLCAVLGIEASQGDSHGV